MLWIIIHKFQFFMFLTQICDIIFYQIFSQRYPGLTFFYCDNIIYNYCFDTDEGTVK